MKKTTTKPKKKTTAELLQELSDRTSNLLIKINDLERKIDSIPKYPYYPQQQGGHWHWNGYQLVWVTYYQQPYTPYNPWYVTCGVNYGNVSANGGNVSANGGFSCSSQSAQSLPSNAQRINGGTYNGVVTTGLAQSAGLVGGQQS